MGILIAIFIAVLAAAIVVPTLPSSRRVRLVLSVVSLLLVVGLYLRVEARASYIGAVHMDYFIERSQQLLQQGKTDVLLSAYQDYRTEQGSRIPSAVAPAFRAWLLEKCIRERELQVELGKKP